MPSLADKVNEVFRQLLPDAVLCAVQAEFAGRDHDAMCELDARIAISEGRIDDAARALCGVRRAWMTGWQLR